MYAIPGRCVSFSDSRGSFPWIELCFPGHGWRRVILACRVAWSGEGSSYMFHVISCSRGWFHARLEPKYMLTYLLDYECPLPFGHYFSRERSAPDYPRHEREGLFPHSDKHRKKRRGASTGRARDHLLAAWRPALLTVPRLPCPLPALCSHPEQCVPNIQLGLSSQAVSPDRSGCEYSVNPSSSISPSRPLTCSPRVRGEAEWSSKCSKPTALNIRTHPSLVCVRHPISCTRAPPNASECACSDLGVPFHMMFSPTIIVARDVGNAALFRACAPKS